MKSVTIYGSTDDGYITGSSTDYATARGTSTSFTESVLLYIGQTIPTTTYSIRRAFVNFDTSVLSGKALIDARLSLFVSTVSLTNPFVIQVVEQDWSGLVLSTTTDRETAYDACLASTSYVDLHAFDAAGILGKEFFSEPLNIDYISTTDSTYYSLRSDKDYENTPPSGPDGYELTIAYSADYTIQSHHPALIVNYTEPPVSPVDGVQYHYLYVDWDGDGETDSWQDEASRVTRFTLDRGKDRTIGSPGSGFQAPNIGRVILTLDNRDGRYDPWNKDGALYGKIQPGRRVNFSVYYNSTYYNLMTGYLADIRPVGYKQQATMIIEDGAGWMASRPPDIPLRAVSDAGDAINAVLDDMGYPFGRNIDDGIDTLAYYWTSGATGLTEIHKLANSDLGRFCVEADGTARFRNRHNSEAAMHTITEDQIGKDIYIPMPWDYTRSIVDVNTYPRILGTTDTTIWTMRDTPTIGTSDTLTLWGEYTYYNQRVPATGVYIHSYQPTTAFASTDVVLTAFSRDARIDITNATTDTETLTELIIKGQPIYSPDKIRIREQADDATGLPATFVMDYEWLTDVNTAQDFAKVLLAFLNDAKEYPEIWIYNRPDIACGIDLEKRLRLVMDTFDIDKTFFVHKISHQSGSTMQELITSVKLYPMLQDIGEDTFILDSVTQGILDTNKLGF